jgi:hypothetical protein
MNTETFSVRLDRSAKKGFKNSPRALVVADVPFGVNRYAGCLAEIMIRGKL